MAKFHTSTKIPSRFLTNCNKRSSLNITVGPEHQRILVHGVDSEALASTDEKHHSGRQFDDVIAVLAR